MQELIIKGLGGQGAKTAIEILAKAANIQEECFLSYPEFGPERTGTPINAYFKIDNKKIRSRTPIQNPDIILVLDKNLKDFSKGLKKNGIIILNSPEEKKFHYVDANKISKELTNKIIPNIVLLGALIKITNLLKKESVEKAIQESFNSKISEINLKCFKQGYEQVK